MEDLIIFVEDFDPNDDFDMLQIYGILNFGNSFPLACRLHHAVCHDYGFALTKDENGKNKALIVQRKPYQNNK